IAKAKSIYGLSLKEEDYERLIKVKDISDIVSYLKRTPNYSEIFKDVNEAIVHRGQIELLIKKNFFKTIFKLIKYAYDSDKSFYELNIIKQESEIILNTISNFISSDSVDILNKSPLFLDVHTKIDIIKVQKSTNYKELLESLVGTDYYKILEKYNVKDGNKVRYLDIEHALLEYYYETTFSLIDKLYKRKLKKELLYIYDSKIEISNIVKIYRLKKFYKESNETIKSILIKIHSRFSEKKLDEIIKIENPNDILKYLSISDYKKINDDEYVYVEYFSEKINFNIAKKYMYFSKEVPLVYTSFYSLLEIEVQNLINIIEGLRYQMDEKELRSMLIY
ncbi:MAG: V-type ATPase subunit, partial [Acholeplasmatales bacterium]|nr:V-type ATPase subunit [Acholeplasmatales bacterium]